MARKAGLSTADLVRCKGKSINTVQHVASAASVSQWQNDKDAMIELTAKVLGLGRQPAAGWDANVMDAIEDDLHKVRLLFSQCYVTHASALDVMARGSAEEKPARLLAPDRKFRHDEIKAHLEQGGHEWHAALENAEAVTDTLIKQHERDRILWEPWGSFVTLEDEEDGNKSDRRFNVDDDGDLIPHPEVGTFQVAEILERRSIALQTARLGSYTCWQRWTRRLLRAVEEKVEQGRTESYYQAGASGGPCPV